MKKFLSTTLIYIIIVAGFLLTPSIVSAQVVINEFQVAPDDWIEIYNKSDESMDISGWIIDDSGGSEKYTVASGIVLQAKKCISFQSGNFNWNLSDDDIKLLDSQSNPIETYHYDDGPGENVSIGRVVDGEGSLEILTSSSRDKFNVSGGSCLQPTPTPSPTPSPTQIPTSTPTATPTKSPTPVPTKSPTPKPTKSPTPEPEVLGKAATSGESKPTPEESLPELTPDVSSVNKKKPIVLPIIFIGSGVLMIGFALYNLIRAKASTVQN